MKSNNRYPFILLVCILSLLCTQCTSKTTSPTEILGVWTTDKDNHEGESIEFTSDKIIMSSSSEVYENPIIKIKASKGDLNNTTLYTVYYADSAGDKGLIHILYSPENGGVLRLKALKDIEWKRGNP